MKVIEIKKQIMKKVVATHSGIFHSDEVLAIALLQVFKPAWEIEIVRTRDAEAIASADLVVDVGGIYSIDGGRFDHHQFNKEDALYGLSSAGLVWQALRHYCGYCDHMSQHCGSDWCTGDPTGGTTSPDYGAITRLVKEVDAQDTGTIRMAEHHFCQIISSFNTADIFSEAQDRAFEEAVAFAKGYIKNLADKASRDFSAKILAESQKIQQGAGFKYVVVNPSTGFINNQLFKNKADLVIQWDAKQSHWTVMSLDAENFCLSSTGRSTENFCHKGGFVGGYFEEESHITIKLNGEDTVIPVK